MKITIGFSRHKGFAPFSKLLCAYMDTDFSHVYMKFKESNMPDATIYHAVGKGLIYLSEQHFMEHNIVVAEYEFDISEDVHNKIRVDFHTQAGTNYGYLQNLGIALVDVLNKYFNCNIKKNPMAEGINCSEWVGQVLDDAIGDWTKIDPSLIKPSDIRNFLKDFYGNNQTYN